MKKKSYDFPVDLVYIWLDGSDENWIKKKNFWAQKYGITSKDEDIAGECRFVNNDELKYSLRSAEKYAPWISNIYIVTDNQCPKWLNTNHPKIHIIDHKDIIPEKFLPTFNSIVIEERIPYIKDLSEHFLYANDDFLFNDYVGKDFFFNKEGKPYCRFSSRIYKYNNSSEYRKSVIETTEIFHKKFQKSIKYLQHHNIDAFTKSSFIECLNEFDDYFTDTLAHKFRSIECANRCIISNYLVYKKHGIFKRVTPNLAKRICALFLKDIPVDSEYMEISKFLKGKKNKYKPSLICVNDGPKVRNEDRKMLKAAFEKYFPDKSSFEL